MPSRCAMGFGPGIVMMIERNFENPELSRVTFSDSYGDAVFEIPPRRNILAIAFMTFWLCGWTVGGFMALSAFLTENVKKAPEAQAFLGFWLCLWAVGWIVVSTQLLWRMFGIEVLTASRTAFSHSFRILSWSRTKNYMPSSIKNLRWVDGPLEVTAGRGFGGIPQSSVSFDYGAKTISVAKGTDAGEGNAIVSRLMHRMALRSGA